MKKLRLFQPQPCVDPAQELQGDQNEGSFIWIDGAEVRLVTAKKGHSIKSIRKIATVPNVVPQSAFGNASGGTLTKISNEDLSEEFDQEEQQGARRAS